eukprot:140229_1
MNEIWNEAKDEEIETDKNTDLYKLTQSQSEPKQSPSIQDIQPEITDTEPTQNIENDLNKLTQSQSEPKQSPSIQDIQPEITDTEPTQNIENDLNKLTQSHSVPKKKKRIKSTKQNMNPLSFLEDITFKPYAKMYKSGVQIDDIENKMIENDVKISLLHRYLNTKKSKKTKKSNQLLNAMHTELKTSTMNSLETEINNDIKHMNRTQSQPASIPISKPIIQPVMYVSTVDKMVQKINMNAKIKKQERQNKEIKLNVKQKKQLNNNWEDNFIEVAKLEIFAAETIINGMKFKLKDELWNNLFQFYENYSQIKCIYECLNACENICISTQCKYLNEYIKMATLGMNIVQI